MALQLANWAYTLLLPGGKLILGNFSSEEPGECLDAQNVHCLFVHHHDNNVVISCLVWHAYHATFAGAHKDCIAGIRAFMDAIMDWKLIYRSPPELLQLIQASAFGKNGKPYEQTAVAGCSSNVLCMHVENLPRNDSLIVVAGCPVHVECGGTSTQLFVVVEKL